ncbi:hypothetical protein Tco_0937700 [Tanacetum coccineum]|uniref:Uncharacterized protein n=1 Tax=Tanacetum coccineum TaxID=301880 RepID=A0ABQ5DF02_9ASTR
MLPVVCKNCRLTPQLHESAGGLPRLKLSLHSCSLPGSTNAMGIPLHSCFPARGEHECNGCFKLGRPLHFRKVEESKSAIFAIHREQFAFFIKQIKETSWHFEAMPSTAKGNKVYSVLGVKRNTDKTIVSSIAIDVEYTCLEAYGNIKKSKGDRVEGLFTVKKKEDGDGRLKEV